MNNQDIASFLEDIKNLKAKADLQSDTNERFALASQKLGELLVATENIEDAVALDTSNQPGSSLFSGATEEKTGKITSLNQTAEKGNTGYTKPAPLTKWWREDQARPLTNPLKVLDKDDTKTAAVLSRPKDRVEISKIPDNSKKKITETQPKKQPKTQKKAGFLSGLRNRNKVLKGAVIASPEVASKVIIEDSAPEETGKNLSVADQAAQHVTQGAGQFEDRPYENEGIKAEGVKVEMAPQKELLISNSPGLNDESKSVTAKAAVATILGLTTVSAATNPTEIDKTVAPVTEEKNPEPVIPTIAENRDPLAPVEETAIEGNGGLSQEVQLAAVATATTAAALALSKSDNIEPEQTPLTPQNPAIDMIEFSDPQPGQQTVTENQETGFDHLPEPELEYAQSAPVETIASSPIISSPLEIAATAMGKPAVKVATTLETTEIPVPLASGEPVIGHGIAPDQSAVTENISTISDDFSLQNTVQAKPVLEQASKIVDTTTAIQPIETQPIFATAIVPETFENVIQETAKEDFTITPTENQPVAEHSATAQPELTHNNVIEAVEATVAAPDIQVDAPIANSFPVQGIPPVAAEAATPQPPVVNAIADTTIAIQPIETQPIFAPAIVPETFENVIQETAEEDFTITPIENQPVAEHFATAQPELINSPEPTNNNVIGAVETTVAVPDIQVAAPIASLPIPNLPVQGIRPVVPEAATPQQPPIAAAPIAVNPAVIAAPIATAPAPNQETVSQEHMVLTGQDIQNHPKYGTKKRGFFSRLFGKKS